MSAATPRKPLTIAIHPNAWGYGWVALEGPFAPYDWGVLYMRKDLNAQCLRRIEEMFRKFLPDTIVLEAYEPHVSARRERTTRLCRGVAALAIDRGVDVAVYTRQQVQSCFASVGARTRHEVAEAVARHLEILRPRLPKPRRAWEGEDRRTALFSAAALALTHYQLGARTLFDALG
jgi:Holliday junction resolvasome RuvABC endonuclease subunit